MTYKDIIQKNLEISIYEYLKIQKEDCPYRAVGLITEQQLVFYSNIEKNDNSTHEHIIWGLSDIMYPQLKGNINDFIFKNEDNVLITIYDRNFYFSLPDNENLSLRQYEMLNYALNQVDKYNNEVLDSKKMNIDILGYIPFDICNLTTKELFEKIKELIVDVDKPYDDVIIGKTYEEIKELLNEDTPPIR